MEFAFEMYPEDLEMLWLLRDLVSGWWRWWLLFITPFVVVVLALVVGFDVEVLVLWLPTLLCRRYGNDEVDAVVAVVFVGVDDDGNNDDDDDFSLWLR